LVAQGVIRLDGRREFAQLLAHGGPIGNPQDLRHLSLRQPAVVTEHA
jgi:hypothetical protein